MKVTDKQRKEAQEVVKQFTERRTFSISSGLTGPEVSIDSGWSKSGVSIDVQTTRGQTVSLTVEQWYVLRDAVEQIIGHCERQRAKGL